MANLDTGIRKTLTDLLQTILDTFHEKKKKQPDGDGLLPDHDRFLKDNNIRLVKHDFDKADSETGLEPPLLFKPRSSSFLEQTHPVNFDLITDEARRNKVKKYPNYGVSHWKGLFQFPERCSKYLEEWAYGGEFRKPPQDFPEMSTFLGIDHVVDGHSLFLGVDLFDNDEYDKFTSNVFEYDREVHGIKPHLILLGAQEKEGQDGSIMLGELMLILAAMRDRAYQPSAVEKLEKGFIDAILRDDTDLVFKDECKFPVLMVSIVAPQHGRIYYACMEDKELVILQSKLYDLRERNDENLNFLSRFLLSEPVDSEVASGILKDSVNLSSSGQKRKLSGSQEADPSDQENKRICPERE